MVTSCSACCSIQDLLILSAQDVHLCHMFITVNTDYFTQQYLQSGRRKLDVSFLRSGSCCILNIILQVVLLKRSCHIPAIYDSCDIIIFINITAIMIIIKLSHQDPAS